MNIDKAKKRIAKQVKKGFNGYPMITIEYLGKTSDLATEIIIKFTQEENEEPQIQKFSSEANIKEDPVIQSVLIKIIDRSNAKSVIEANNGNITLK